MVTSKQAEEMARCEREAMRRFPDATRIRTGLTGGVPYVEVWTGSSARTWAPEWTR